MIALYILCGIVAVIALLLSSPVSLYFYFRDDIKLTLRVWGVPIPLLPRIEKMSTQKPTISETQIPSKRSKLDEIKETFGIDSVGAVIYWLKHLVSLFTKTLGRLCGAITVRQLRLEMRVSGEDAAAAAVHHGEVCTAVYPLLATLMHFVRIKKHDVDIRPDFLGRGNAVLAEVKANISLWKLAGAAILFLCGLLKIYFKNDTKPKTERTVTNNG